MPPELQIHAQNEGALLRLEGALSRDTVNILLKHTVRFWNSSQGDLILDFSGVTSIDSAGAASLLALYRQGNEHNAGLMVIQVPAAIKETLSLFVVPEKLSQEKVPKKALLERLGEAGFRFGDLMVSLLLMASETTAEALLGVRHPKRVRWGEVTLQMARIGSNALGTVGLITFLIGLTLAFQSAHQLRQYGAAMWVADLTAVAMFREMGPLMTAILVAGRSGSAIAAEIATMKVSEELDALAVMGIPFTRFLGLPRVLAMLVVMPMLVIMADLIGILGGLSVGVVYLDLSVVPYLNATLNALGPKDLIMSLVKAVSFGWGIVIIALNMGATVQGGAQEVGTATTASVVQSLFFIILMDALFSVLFYVVL